MKISIDNWYGFSISIYSWHPLSRASLGAKIRERELSASPVITRFRAKAQTHDLQDHSPTLWRLHLLNPNSMLSDNRCTYISLIFSDIDIAPATNHKPYYILIIMIKSCQITCYIRRHTMESVLKPSKPRCGLTGNGNGSVSRRGFHRRCMSFLVKNSRITFQITLISALLVLKKSKI